MKYYRRNSNYIVQAEQFRIGNIDSFVRFIENECSDIIIYPRKCAVIYTCGFDPDGILIVPEGNYLVMGSEIPDTLPKPIHEFSVVSGILFRARFSDTTTIGIEYENE